MFSPLLLAPASFGFDAGGIFVVVVLVYICHRGIRNLSILSVELCVAWRGGGLCCRVVTPHVILSCYDGTLVFVLMLVGYR